MPYRYVTETKLLGQQDFVIGFFANYPWFDRPPAHCTWQILMNQRD